MKLTIEKCKATTDSLHDYINGLPERMTFDQVSDPKSELFSDLDSDEICDPVEASIQVPMYTKRFFFMSFRWAANSNLPL